MGSGGADGEIEGYVTAIAAFTPEERNLLARLPRWIVGAASAAHVDNAAKTRRKIEIGFISVANGRRFGNAFVTEVSALAMRVFDEDPKKSGVDPSTAEGCDAILEHARTAWTLLRTKAEPADTLAYRRYLLEVTDDVINATRSDEVLGFGGVQIHPTEKAFRDRLAGVLR
jgi:hypothetical protein